MAEPARPLARPRCPHRGPADDQGDPRRPGRGTRAGQERRVGDGRGSWWRRTWKLVRRRGLRIARGEDAVGRSTACFGRIDRSRLIPRDGIPEERAVKVRDAVQFGRGVGLGPGSGFWARSNPGLTGPLPPSGGTGQAFESSWVPFPVPSWMRRESGGRSPARRVEPATVHDLPIARPVGGP